MSAQIKLDEEEEFERTKNFIEYLAVFSNPEAVKKIKDLEQNTVRSDPKSMEKTLKDITKGKI